MSCPGREQMTERMADRAFQRGRLHQTLKSIVCGVWWVFPQAQLIGDEAKEREPEEERMVGDTRRKTGGTGLLFFSPFLRSLSVFNLACGVTHRLQARWQSWLACFVQKQQRPRQCRIRPYRNPHSLKPGPHPHSLQQSDTQPQPTALDTPGRGEQTRLR